MTTGKIIPSVSVTYVRNGRSTRSNELGMRPMQERAWGHLRGDDLLRKVYDGQRFADGFRVITKAKAAA